MLRRREANSSVGSIVCEEFRSLFSLSISGVNKELSSSLLLCSTDMDDTSLSAVLLSGRNERVSMKVGGRRVALAAVELLKISLMYFSRETMVKVGAVPILKSSSKFIASKTSSGLSVGDCGVEPAQGKECG